MNIQNNTIYRYLLLLLLCLCIHQGASGNTDTIDQLDWVLKKESKGIQVYSANMPESAHKAILSVTTIDADVNTLVDIISTPSTCIQWVYRCRQSYLYEQTAEQEYIVYTANNMPFPVQNRDIIARIKWETDPTTHIVRARGKAIKHTLPKNKQHIRIEKADMIWELIPLTKQKTKVRSYIHADPAGHIPAWLTNYFSVNIPLKTMQGLKNLIHNKNTQNQ